MLNTGRTQWYCIVGDEKRDKFWIKTTMYRVFRPILHCYCHDQKPTVPHALNEYD